MNCSAATPRHLIERCTLVALFARSLRCGDTVRFLRNFCRAEESDRDGRVGEDVASLTDPDVLISSIRFFTGELRSRRCSGGRSGLLVEGGALGGQ
jgi:hypothetical protein